jgi:hypothetical protein
VNIFRKSEKNTSGTPKKLLPEPKKNSGTEEAVQTGEKVFIFKETFFRATRKDFVDVIIEILKLHRFRGGDHRNLEAPSILWR